jgi:hypothetical protein
MAKQDPDVYETLRATLRALTDQIAVLETELRRWKPVPAVGPQQITEIGKAPGGEPLVTVTYPVGEDTVLSIQPPHGTVETRPAGTQGPYETGLQLSDRIVYAPTGPSGPVFVLPYTGVVPNA